ncbi:MAG TPA: hypothetical protein VK327_18775 [Candidatus Paceibacterota bacterium]|nr:hypothetical protein [Candidatus Paceibacterota bacterium]
MKSKFSFKPVRGLLAAGALVLLLTLLFAAAFTGCVSKKEAQAQARMAYLAGQRDAIAKLNEGKNPTIQPDASQSSNVTFVGPVENPVVPWVPGLTLAKAILTAVYHSQTDPAMIVIHRPNEQIQVDPVRLLDGGDIALKPGDVIQFQLPPQ